LAKQVEVLEEFPLTYRFHDLYLLGYPFFAALDNKAYVLTVAEMSYIQEIGLGRRRLRSFPSGVNRMPTVMDTGRIVETFRSMEAAIIPSGLYAWRGTIFVLSRKPRLQEEGTLWQLTAIDPCLDAVLSTFTLPTSSPHIAIVPGDKFWAVLEKGSVSGAGTQEFLGIKFLPAPWFRRESRRPVGDLVCNRLGTV
jgi:hypothetical protein